MHMVDRDDIDGVASAAEARVEGWFERLSAEIRAAQAGAGRRPSTQGPAAGRDSELLEGVRRDADGFAFTRQLLESVVNAGDPFSAALGLRAASKSLPPSLPARDRLAVRAGGVASLGLPWAVLPIARKWLRGRVSPLVLSAKIPEAPESRDAEFAELRSALARHAEFGCATVLALRGEGVLGPAGVEIETARLVSLARQPEVTHLAIDPERLIAGGSAWSIDRDAQLAALALRPVLEVAAQHGTAIQLEPTSYRGALLTPELLVRALGDAEFDGVRAGATLLAELPESRGIAERLIRWAKARRADGGAPVELTVAIGRIAGGEQIASIDSGLAVPTLEGRTAQEAQLVRIADYLLSASAGGAVVPVVASEDPHLLAVVAELADRHGAGDLLEMQLRAGTATTLARLIAADRPVRLRLPVTPPKEFAGVLDGLIALAAEAADPDSALSRLGTMIEGATDPVDPLEQPRSTAHPARARAAEALGAERERVREVLAIATEPFPESHRVQQRGREWDPSERDSALFYRPPADTERFDTGGLTAAVLGLTRGSTGHIVLEPAGPPLRVPVVSASGFANEPETDASRADNRDWVRRLLAAAGESRGDAPPEPAGEAGADADTVIDAALAAGAAWREQRPVDRATRVRRLALGTVAARDRLFTALATESGAPAPVIDAEINGAVDAARYLGQLAAGLGAVRGAEFRPDAVTLVVVGAGVPLDERAEALTAVLAAGSTAVLVAHPSVRRSSDVLLEEWRAAGLPAGLVACVPQGAADTEGFDLVEAAAPFAADPRVDRALVLGDRETAEALVRRRPDLRVLGRFRTLGSVLVTPSADRVLAVRNAVRSAFGAAPASASTANALVLLGGAARSRRLRALLGDAVRALRVGDSAKPGDQDPLIFDVGPLPGPVGEAGRRALTQLDPGEEWLVEPVQLDEAGRLWQPGVRIGVRRDSPFWADAIGMPVVGVISARTLDEAVALQNELGAGSVAGLQATEAGETVPWLERVRAATLVVGRPTTGGRVERLPGGGWGRAAMGVQALAGGPNRLLTLGSWVLREGTRSQTLHLRGLDPEVRVLIAAAQATLDYESFDLVRRAALSDALTWRTTLGAVRDDIGLGVEHNLLRRWPVPTHVRLAQGGEMAELIRVLAAALVVGAQVSVSTGEVLAPEVAAFLSSQGIEVSLERDDAWLERIAVVGPGGFGDGGSTSADGLGGRRGSAASELEVSRVRLIGGDRSRAAEWMGGLARVSLWADPVTMSGPVELLAFLREQSIAISAHRYGLVSAVAGVDEWIAELQA